jgi:hypothetical protein
MANPTMKGDLMFPNEYLSAPDLKGRDVTVTIGRVERQTLKTNKGDESKWIILFSDAKKKLVLNKTNAQAIAKVHGSKAELWIGKKITVYPTTCQAFGAITDCVRVRDKVGKSAPVQDEQETADEPVPY